MKDFVKFAPNALIIAVLAGFMQFINDNAAGYFVGWIGFAAWACYFLAGCTPKGGAKVIGCWIAGVLASVAIVELGQVIGFPLAVGIIAFCVILFEKVPALDFIPAWFVGAACFFAAHKGDYKASVSAVLISCVVAQVFGFVTVLLRSNYEKMIAPKEEPEQA